MTGAAIGTTRLPDGRPAMSSGGVAGSAATRGLLAAAARMGLRPTALVLGASLAAIAVCGAFREAALVALPEELLFRGIVQGEIAARTGRPRLAVVLAAALFALAHAVAGGGAAGLLTFFPGLAFGLLRIATGQLWPAVAAHAIANRLVA